MKRTKLLALSALIFLGLASCSKQEIAVEQVRKDVEIYYQQLFAKSFRYVCTPNVFSVDILERWTKDDKTELKVRTGLKLQCRLTLNSEVNGDFMTSRIESSSNLKVGSNFFQDCFKMQYEKFSEGFKLQGEFNQDENCPSSEVFDAYKRLALENLLKETALAACTCKQPNSNCTHEENICRIYEERDINGDGIAEMVLSDAINPRNGIDFGSTWAIINGSPKMILPATISLKDLPVSDGFPSIKTSDEIGCCLEIITTYQFDVRRGEYVKVGTFERKI